MLQIRFNAKTEEELSRGLMYSAPLEDDECAVFTFKYPSDHSFWNKNVTYPISLLFLDDNLRLVHIGHLNAHQESSCSSHYPYVKYVIECHEDYPKKNNVEIGDYFSIKDDSVDSMKGSGNYFSKTKNR